MELLITKNDKLWQLYQKHYRNDKTFPPNYRYNCVLSSGIWFHLVNEESIIAYCSLHIQNNTNYIGDVWVEEPFRGNGYAFLLLMNIIDYIDQNNETFCKITNIVASNDNIPAIKTYEKLFRVMQQTDSYTYFTLNHHQN
jgi:RimJ/RimL family protein N-acetyltransferase